MLTHISVRGAKEHNLKNVSVDIPRDQLTVITGLSGSGKSSLAFDTIYAEGQRRYVESLSAYARQFLEMMQKPDVEHIDGLAPATSIEATHTTRQPRGPPPPRPPLPREDAETGRRAYRRLVARHLDRAEDHQPQSPLDGRHRHRNLRLYAPALGARRHPLTARHRRADPGPAGQPNGRPGNGPARRQPPLPPRPRRPRPPGRAAPRAARTAA